MVQELLQRARFVVTATLGAQQEIEAGASIGGQRGGVEGELALEAVEHGTEHARDHGGSASRATAAAELDDERAERPRVRGAQCGDEDGDSGARDLQAAAARQRVARALLVEKNPQVEPLEGVGAPHELR